MIWAARAVSRPVIRLASDQELHTQSPIVIEAPNGIQVEVVGEVRIPPEMKLHATVRNDEGDR